MMTSEIAWHSHHVERFPKVRSKMPLSRKLVEKFQALHHEKYGEDISYDAAELQLKELAELVRIVAMRQEAK